MLFEFDFSEDKLSKIIPSAKFGVHTWYVELYEMLPIFEINSIARVASFLAQTSHESGGYTTLEENLNYRAEGLVKTWPSRFPTLEFAKGYHRQPTKIANRAYADRMGNGDEASGDGYLYRGRGLIQLTGKSNYTQFAQYCQIYLSDVIEYLETPRGAVHSACWFWSNNNLNKFADENDLVGMTRRINGGTHGLDDRIAKHFHATQILSIN